MSKRLIITYGDVVLYDGEPEEFSWQESRGAVMVKAGQKRANPFDGFGQALADASKRQTAQRHQALASLAAEGSQDGTQS